MMSVRAEYISKSTEVRETFSFASPVEVLRSLKVFVGDMYGSNLWQLSSDMAMHGTPTLSWSGVCPAVLTHTLWTGC